MEEQTLITMRLVYAEVADLVAIECRVAGMQAMNQSREDQGYAQAYGEGSFFEEAEKAEAIHKRLKGDG